MPRPSSGSPWGAPSQPPKAGQGKSPPPHGWNWRKDNIEDRVSFNTELAPHSYAVFVQGTDRSNPNAPKRCFDFSEEARGTINPHDSKVVYSIQYCPVCAREAHLGVTALVAEAEFEATAWVNDREYSIREKLMKLGDQTIIR